jgi:predicted component of type VI protein secretion system
MAGLRQLTKASETIIPLSGTFKIGRDPRNDLVIDEQQVSRWHATIAEVDGVCVISDQGSRHGTYTQRDDVDEPQRIKEPAVLHDGDIIRIGKSRLIFDEKISYDFQAPAARVPPVSEGIDITQAFPRTEPGRVVPIMFNSDDRSLDEVERSHAGSQELRAVLDKLADLESRVSKLEAQGIDQVQGASE